MPFETATKILRARRVADRAARPRSPDVFWSERLEQGSGGTCFARVAAFDRLISELGFSTRKVLGRVRDDFDHAALLVRLGGHEWICDVGFPLTVLLPARPGRTEGPIGAYAVRETPRGFAIDFEGGVPDGPRGLEIFGGSVGQDEYVSRWEETFRPDSKFVTQVVLHRFQENRVIVFVRGEVRVDDRHSRLTLPLVPPRAPVLAELFGMDAGLIAEALAAAGDPDPPGSDAAIEVFLESSSPAERAFSAIASPEGYAQLLEGVAEVAVRTKGPLAFEASLRLPGDAAAPGVEEEIEIDSARQTLVVRRAGRVSQWRAEEREGRTWLIRRAELSGPRPDLLRNDSLRGRFAGALAVDLLAWARRLGRQTV